MDIPHAKPWRSNLACGCVNFDFLRRALINGFSHEGQSGSSAFETLSYTNATFVHNLFSSCSNALNSDIEFKMTEGLKDSDEMALEKNP